MKKILGTCLLIPLLLLAACNSGGTSGPATEGQATADAATVEATEVSTPTSVATTEAITDTTDMSETSELTGTESLTGTEEMTGSDMLSGTEEMTGTEGMTDTGSISGAGVTGSTGITGTESMSDTAGIQEAPRQLILASDLQDYNVENAQGDSLGSVDDLVLNLENGQVLLVTLKYGGLLGIGDKTFPIPLSAFRFDQETADVPAAPAVPGDVITDTNAMTGTDGMMGTDTMTGTGAMTGTDGMTGTGALPGAMTESVVVGTRLILDIPEESFENAPGIDEDMNLTDPTTVGDIETFYRDLGEDVIGRPIAETNLDELTGRVIKLSDLDGANVNNPDGDGVGEIDDILVDLRAGRVEYFILSFGGFLGIGDNLYAIPMDAFSVIPTSADVENGSPTLVLNVTEEELQNAPVFNADELNSPSWDMEAHDFWLQNR